MRISHSQEYIKYHYPQNPLRESDFIITYPAARHNVVRDEYVIEQSSPYDDGAVETARSIGTYSIDNGIVSLSKNAAGILVDVYA